MRSTAADLVSQLKKKKKREKQNPNVVFIYQLQTMAVKLQPPSGTELPAFNPILPPAAVTQILLLANPNKVGPDISQNR